MLNNNNETAETIGPSKMLISTSGSFFGRFHHEINKADREKYNDATPFLTILSDSLFCIILTVIERTVLKTGS